MIKVHLNKEKYESLGHVWEKEHDFIYLGDIQRKIVTGEDADIDFHLFETFKERGMLNVSDVTFINKFGFTNFAMNTISGSKDEEKEFNSRFQIQTFPFMQSEMKFKFFDENTLNNEEKILPNNNSIVSTMEELSKWNGEGVLKVRKTSEHIINFLQEWTSIFGVKLEILNVFNGVDVFDLQFDEFPKLRFKTDNVKWKEFDIYANPAVDRDKTKISQKMIIDSILGNSLKAVNGEPHKDHFITAPTGSGKSLIFQTVAYELSKKKLLTVVISPLKSLMMDQVRNLKETFGKVETINSDINFIERSEIIRKIASGDIDIVYISPETLLANNYGNLFGERKLGLFVVDEAHIATTWGKGFRPDYWYLDTWIKRTRKDNGNFEIATFTATASYHNIKENAMNNETINNLDMINAIQVIAPAYRKDIDYDIVNTFESMDRHGYESRKKNDILKLVKSIGDKKIIIYAPYASQVDKLNVFLGGKGIKCRTYHGGMDKNDKVQNTNDFIDNKINVLIATKAFGMGIDIPDIEHVIHYAPTGSMNDYLQEIGRAARKKELTGTAHIRTVFQERSNKGLDDHTHIKQLEGMSAIREFEIKKIARTIINFYNKSNKKKNLLIPLDNFSLNFGNNKSADGDEKRSKTAFVMLQRDIENRVKFPGVIIRPSNVFTKVLTAKVGEGEKNIFDKYAEPTNIYEANGKIIYKLNLEKVWEEHFEELSFPYFKYLYFTTIAHMNKMNELSDAIKSKIKKLKHSYNPRQVIDFGDIDVKSKIDEACSFIEDIVNKLTIETISFTKKDIFNLANSEGTNPFKIIEILDALNKYGDFMKESLDARKVSVMNHTLISYDSFKEVYSVKKKDFMRSMRLELMNVCKWKMAGNKIVMPIVNDIKDSYKRTMFELKLLELTEKFEMNILSGEMQKVFIKVNSINTLYEAIDDGYKNMYVEAARTKFNYDTRVSYEFFTREMSNEDRRNFIENYFLLDDKSLKLEEDEKETLQ